MLSVPLSAASSERNWSLFGHLFSKKRCRTSSANLDDQVYCVANRKPLAMYVFSVLNPPSYHHRPPNSRLPATRTSYVVEEEFEPPDDSGDEAMLALEQRMVGDSPDEGEGEGEEEGDD